VGGNERFRGNKSLKVLLGKVLAVFDLSGGIKGSFIRHHLPEEMAVFQSVQGFRYLS
jgi:hypothetical protein